VAQTTVFYNGVRDIEFDVTDKSGIVHTVVVKGSGAGIRGVNGQPLPAVGAYGVTVVDADLWNAVKKKYADMQIFKDGFIRDGATEKAKAEAKEVVSSLDNGQAPAGKEEDGNRKKRKK
jgi:hypothetical protein